MDAPRSPPRVTGAPVRHPTSYKGGRHMNAQQTAPSGSGLSRPQLAALEARLLSERETLTQRLASRRRALADVPARETDESDWASDSADQSLAVRLVDRDTKLLQEVKSAL